MNAVLFILFRAFCVRITCEIVALFARSAWCTKHGSEVFMFTIRNPELFFFDEEL